MGRVYMFIVFMCVSALRHACGSWCMCVHTCGDTVNLECSFSKAVHLVEVRSFIGLKIVG